MRRSWQFSLAYVFLETFWIAAFLGSIRLSAATPIEYLWLALPLNLLTFAVALGGAVGQMRSGSIIGGALAGSILQGCLMIQLPSLLLDMHMWFMRPYMGQ